MVENAVKWSGEHGRGERCKGGGQVIGDREGAAGEANKGIRVEKPFCLGAHTAGGEMGHTVMQPNQGLVWLGSRSGDGGY